MFIASKRRARSMICPQRRNRLIAIPITGDSHQWSCFGNHFHSKLNQILFFESLRRNYFCEKHHSKIHCFLFQKLVKNSQTFNPWSHLIFSQNRKIRYLIPLKLSRQYPLIQKSCPRRRDFYDFSACKFIEKITPP